MKMKKSSIMQAAKYHGETKIVNNKVTLHLGFFVKLSRWNHGFRVTSHMGQ